MNLDVRFSSDPDEIDVERVHRWLSDRSYWARGRTLEAHRRAMAASRNYGAYDVATGMQLGYARVITDEVTFAYLADVYVDDGARGAGIGKTLVEGVVADLEPLGLRRIALVTSTAHGLYEQYGFRVLDNPGDWMVRAGRPTG
jgi:ribosomal protein S18 acetylase RimI-like enzyme